MTIFASAKAFSAVLCANETFHISHNGCSHGQSRQETCVFGSMICHTLIACVSAFGDIGYVATKIAVGGFGDFRPTVTRPIYPLTLDPPH